MRFWRKEHKILQGKHVNVELYVDTGALGTAPTVATLQRPKIT